MSGEGEKYYETYPVSEVVSEYEISRKRVGERLVKVQNLQQPVSLDGVQVTVGEGAHVGSRLSQRRVLPERIAKDVTLACVWR